MIIGTPNLVKRYAEWGDKEKPAIVPTRDLVFYKQALELSQLVKCTRKKVGAIITLDYHQVGAGYNGSASGYPECINGACPRGKLSYKELAGLTNSYDDPTSPGYCISVHAEQNALLDAGRRNCKGATCYVTYEPCERCQKLLLAAGIVRVVFPKGGTGLLRSVRAISPSIQAGSALFEYE